MRVPAVTRTITSTKVVALCVDVLNQKAIEQTFELPRTYSSKTQVLRRLQKLYDNENFKVINVISTYVIKTLYGMKEEDFLKVAKKITDRDKLI